MADVTPSFREAAAFWWKLGWISFGGPTGQIALMQTEVVERKKWVEEKRFLHALNYCMMLPGPEAQQLATYLGWSLHGVWGGVVAGVFFVLPSTFILWALSLIYVLYGNVPWIAAAFYGLIPAVIGMVFHALLRLGQKTLTQVLRWIIALGALCLIMFFHNGYPWIILGAGLLGFFLRPNNSPQTTATAPPTPLQPLVLVLRALWCLGAWFTPLLVLILVLGRSHTVVQEGIFFSQAALITFGGAYAILPYVAHAAVENYHWLTPEQMIQGFGLAETTPGPLIIVLQFVGFLGGWHQPGLLSPLLAATLGAFITTWVTFAPSFLYILVGAPIIDRLAEVRALQAALGAISAAVVGVMTNFALWFAGHAIFTGNSPDFFVLALSIASFIALRFFKVEIVPLIGVCAALGVVVRLVF